MAKIDRKIAVASLLIGIVGIFLTIFPSQKSENFQTSSITVISNNNSNQKLSSSTTKINKVLKFEELNTTPPEENRNNSLNRANMTEPKLTNTELIISAVGSDIVIRKGKTSFPYLGGEISAINTEQTIYLPKGQLLQVKLTGTGANLSIERSIAEQVNVINSGTGANIDIF